MKRQQISSSKYSFLMLGKLNIIIYLFYYVNWSENNNSFLVMFEGMTPHSFSYFCQTANSLITVEKRYEYSKLLKLNLL